MKRTLILIILLLTVAPHFVSATNVVFWFNNNTSTIFMTGSSTVITTINATYNTIINETTSILVKTNTTNTTETVLLTQEIIINNTTITKYFSFICTYGEDPQNYQKIIQKTTAIYPSTTTTAAKILDRITIVGPNLGTQTINRTASINNNISVTEYTQYYSGGTFVYTEISSINTTRKISINLQSPIPVVGTVMIQSNPFTTIIKGYLNAVVNGKNLNYIINGTDTFTVTATYGTKKITIMGNQTAYTFVINSYTIEYNPTPTIIDNGKYTIFPDPPFVLYLDENVPIILNATKVEVNTRNEIMVLTIESANFLKFSTIKTTTLELPPNAAGFIIKENRLVMSKNNIKIIGTIYTNNYNTTAPRNIVIPNLYNAQNAISLITSVSNYFTSLETFTLYTVKIYAPLKIQQIKTTPNPLIINNHTYDTIQKITVTLVNNATITTLYEYTFAGDKIMETYYNFGSKIIYITTLIDPTTITTVYTKTENTMTMTITMTTNIAPGTYIVTVTTNYLMTTIAKPTIFSAIKSEIITNQRETTINVDYRSPKITELVNSVTNTVIMYLVIKESNITIRPAQTNTENTAFGFTLSTTAPQEVQQATGRTLGIVLYIVMALLFIGLLWSAFCIVRADDDDTKKSCLIRTVLIGVAIIIIYLLPKILDWVTGA